MKSWSERRAADRRSGDRPNYKPPEQDNRSKQGHRVPRRMRQSLVAEYTHWVGSNQKLAVTAGIQWSIRL
jgi:hypothetical protein